MSWAGAQAARLADGRLHLHHGPIDLIIKAHGSQSERACQAAKCAFEPLLANLTSELPTLRAATTAPCPFQDPVAKRMHAATKPYRPAFITPMAAVAGAVADHILSAMLAEAELDRAYVNNGGDIALYLASGQALTIASTVGFIEISSMDKVRGIATSGWRGRSQSLGIADAVTVLAADAAQADAAATMIANEIDLPDHRAISRMAANQRAPDSDLGGRLVTIDVGPLSKAEVTRAMEPGMRLTELLIRERRIDGVSLQLQGEVWTAGLMAQVCRRTALAKRVNTPHAQEHFEAAL